MSRDARITGKRHERGTTVSADSRQDHAPASERRWWSVIPESVVGLAAISALELAFWRFGEIATIELQLYWVFVLLQSVRRGLRAGLLVALLAAVSYAALAVGVPGAMPSSYDRLAAETFFVLLVAMFVGDLRERWRGREKRLIGRTAELSDALDDLAKEYLSASEVIAELGRRIAEQTVTMATIDTISRRLDVLDSADLFPALLQLLAHSLRVERASVFLLEDGQLVLKAHVPDSESTCVADDVTDNDLVREALASRAPRHIRITAVARAGNPSASVPVLLAAPLLDPIGQPIGIVTVERMAFLAFNSSTVRSFEILVGWASRSLQNALRFERACASSADPDEEASLLTFPNRYPLDVVSGGSSRTDTAATRRFVAAPSASLMRSRAATRFTFGAYLTRSRWSRRLRTFDPGVTRSKSTNAAK